MTDEEILEATHSIFIHAGEEAEDLEPVHGWFGLTYASYLCLPRSLLEAMPVEWQRRFVGCLRELEAEFPVCWPPDGTYDVRVRNEKGRFVDDPLRQYRRPDRVLIESLRRKE